MTTEQLEALGYNAEAIRRILEIIAAEKMFNSAIFWKTGSTYYSFTREFGTNARPDLDDKTMAGHLRDMVKENAQIFIRGAAKEA